MTCGNYKPQFFTVIGRQCAAFGVVPPGNFERCGAWTKRPGGAGSGNAP